MPESLGRLLFKGEVGDLAVVAAIEVIWGQGYLDKGVAITSKRGSGLR